MLALPTVKHAVVVMVKGRVGGNVATVWTIVGVVVLLGVECNIYRVLNAVVVAINWTTVAKSSVHGGAIVAFNGNAVAVVVAARLWQTHAGIGE